MQTTQRGKTAKLNPRPVKPRRVVKAEINSVPKKTSNPSQVLHSTPKEEKEDLDDIGKGKLEEHRQTQSIETLEDNPQVDDTLEAESTQGAQGTSTTQSTQTTQTTQPEIPENFAEKLNAALLTVQTRTEEKFSAQIEALNQRIENLQGSNKQLSADLEKATQAAQVATEENENATSVLSVLEKFGGVSIPSTTTQSTPKPEGEMKLTVGNGPGSDESHHFNHLVTTAHRQIVNTPTGIRYQADTHASDAYLRQNLTKIREGLEAELISNGFPFIKALNSGQVTPETNALTQISDIPSSLWNFLSAITRTTSFPDLIHHQFALTNTEIGVRPGLTMGIPVYPDIPAPSAIADRALTEGTEIDGSAQRVAQKLITLTISEYGLGKDSSNAPLGFTNFAQAYSLVNLEQLIVEKLGKDYAQWKDLTIRTQLFGTDVVVYNNAGNVTTTPADVTEDGTFTEDFSMALEAFAKEQRIEPMTPDGKYGLILNTRAALQFMRDKSKKEQDFGLQMGNDLITRMVSQNTGIDGGAVTGYLGEFANMHIFRHNVYGLPGGTEGVNSETMGGSGRECLSSFLVGKTPIIWGTALPMEIRMSDERDFQRQDRLIWYSHEGWKAYQVKNTTSTGERLGVIEIRTTSSAFS